jgi:hypothetical protein
VERHRSGTGRERAGRGTDHTDPNLFKWEW